jgi:hypothetical protein
VPVAEVINPFHLVFFVSHFVGLQLLVMLDKVVDKGTFATG